MLGADVVHRGNAKVHVSGHASAGELLYVYNIVKPKNVMPVHGEWRHLVANAELAVATGVPRERVLARRGRRSSSTSSTARPGSSGRCRAATSTSTAQSVGGTTETLLKDRRILRDEGFITCIVVIDAATGKIAAGPEITARGFVEDEEIFRDIIPKVEQALAEATGNGVRDEYQLQQVIRRTIGSWVGGTIRRRPMIIPVVIEA